jgi:hypothetical protein
MEYFILKRFQTFVYKFSASSGFEDGWQARLSAAKSALQTRRETPAKSV